MWESSKPLRAKKRWETSLHTQLQKLLKSYEVVVIDPLGEPFDPYKHEAIGMVPVTDKELDHKILNVLQKGYEIKVGDTMEVIRPARVTTGEYSELSE